MVIIALAFLVAAQSVCASDNQSASTVGAELRAVINRHSFSVVEKEFNEYKIINQGLLDLVARNNIIGTEHRSDGQNLELIKEYLEHHKNKIDFAFTGLPYGFSDSHTPLTLACCQHHCSAMLVELLCKHGADPNEKVTVKVYPGTFCLHTLATALGGKATSIITSQREKFAILKKYAVYQKLSLNDTRVVRENFVEDPEEKEFMAGAEIVVNN